MPTAIAITIRIDNTKSVIPLPPYVKVILFSFSVHITRYVQGYESASKRAFVISIAFGLMSHPIKFRFSSLQTTAVVPLPK